MALQTAKDEKEFAGIIASIFRDYGRGKLLLAVVNTVESARQVHRHLCKQLGKEGPDIRLVHSRFRPAERQAWREEFLNRQAPIPPAGRIIVSTQVVEAGVDLDASALVTEIAPWPSLVQRFGRAARGGGTAQVVVVACQSKNYAPYSQDEIENALATLKRLADAAPLHLEKFEENLTENERQRLYPYQPRHLLLRHEWDELFDTTPDLTGADVDISRFIRASDECDLQIFWMEIPKGESPPPDLQPSREALCAVPSSKAREWLCGKETRTKKAPHLKEGMRAWVWDWLANEWRQAKRADMLPGRIILVDARCGGYTRQFGWDPESTEPVPVIQQAAVDPAGDMAHNEDPLSIDRWKTIAEHGDEVARMAGGIARQLFGETSQLLPLMELAARWHDVGKAHLVFQGSIRSGDRPARNDLAKAPAATWLPRHERYRSADDRERRPAFRHELASALALFAVLMRHCPDHPALLGPWRELLSLPQGDAISPNAPTVHEKRILDLTAAHFDLLAYLVASHHGKVRLTLHACPADQDYRDIDGRGLPIRGVREGDMLPGIAIASDGQELPPLTLTLEPAMVGLSPRTGASWTERTLGLVGRYGPAALAFLEACFRAADIRASRGGRISAAAPSLTAVSEDSL